ncbi:MAG: hypothetical protein ACQEQE_10815 [Bacillota bacterium]
MSVKIILIFTTTFILLMFSIIIWAYLRLKKLKRNPSLNKGKYKSDNFLNKSYHFFKKIFFLKNYIFTIEKSLKIIDLSDQKTIQNKVAKYIYFVATISISIFIIIIYQTDKIYFLILSLLLLIVINQQVLNYYLSSLEKNLLKQFDKFLSRVKHFYHNHQMIDEAIYDTTLSYNKKNYKMNLHAREIYKVLNSENPQQAIDSYYDKAPNKFFKTFVALAHFVQKFGDKRIDDRSVLMTNINYLKEELKYELLKRKKLDYLFKSLSIISIIPVFFINPLKNWGMYHLKELKVYFNGSYGFIVQIILFLLVFLSYMFINKMKSEHFKKVNSSNKFLSHIVKISFINNFLNKLINKNYSYFKLMKKRLKRLGKKISVKKFYLKQFIFAILAFSISFLVFFQVINLEKKSILYPTDESIKTSEFDKPYVLSFNNKDFKLKDIKDKVKREEKLDGKILDKVSERIFKKTKKYSQIYFKWYYLLIIFLVTILFYKLPIIFLYFKEKMLKMKLEEEILQLQTIIMMLMHFERLNVEDILRSLERFSFIFKSSIGKCLDNIDHGEIQALEELKIDEPFEPFVKLVDNLISASEKISISLAFDELVLERKYYQEKRKQENEMMINQKGMLGKIIAFLPISFLIFFYLLIPFLLVSFNQLINYSNQVKDIL